MVKRSEGGNALNTLKTLKVPKSTCAQQPSPALSCAKYEPAFPKPKPVEKKRVGIRKRSRRREREEPIYRAKRIAFLNKHETCQRCNTAPATDVHHTQGRVGHRYLATTTWEALCRPCHEATHGRPRT